MLRLVVGIGLAICAAMAAAQVAPKPSIEEKVLLTGEEIWIGPLIVPFEKGWVFKRHKQVSVGMAPERLRLGFEWSHLRARGVFGDPAREQAFLLDERPRARELLENRMKKTQVPGKCTEEQQPQQRYRIVCFGVRGINRNGIPEYWVGYGYVGLGHVVFLDFMGEGTPELGVSRANAILQNARWDEQSVQ
jgi:hypothetical protein